MIRWFTCLNDGTEEVRRHIRVAIRSAARFTNIAKYCVFSGHDKDLLAFFDRYQVHVIPHQLSFSSILERRCNRTPAHLRIATGAFLRLDIPEIIYKHGLFNDSHYLYTDVDVMIKTDLKELVYRTPEYLDAAPESNPNATNHFNSGVIWCNTKNMLATADECKRWAADDGFRMEFLDQELLNDIYGWRRGRLPNEYNWKPYWGVCQNPQVIHWHGPKPYHIKTWSGLHESVRHAYRSFVVPETMGAYEKYIEEYDRLAGIQD